MKHLKLFFALFAMLAINVGNAWAEDYSATHTSNVTFTAGTNGSTAKVKINSVEYDAMKLGASSKTGTMTFKIPVGTTKIHLHVAGWNGKNTKLNLSANNGVTLGTTSITSTADNGVANNSPFTLATPANATTSYYKVVEITSGATVAETTITIQTTSTGYRAVVWGVNAETESGGSGSTEPALSATPKEIDFGAVYQGTTVEDQTVTVNFENLTGNVTYSGLTTPFTATGTVSNDGDKITIAANTATIGEYSQTLTIEAADKSVEVTVKMNVVEKPAPTGTFTLHTGALVEGDYVIVSTNSLKAEVNSDRLASLPVTISNDEIEDPDATTIWHIAKSGEYWTLYNANKAKYAASTGVKNKAALLNDATDDKALWSVTGTSTYEFVNKKNAASALNANLRYNSQNAENSRWACYSTSTGAALSLYRKAGEKYDVNIASTTNGTVTASPTSAEAGATIALTVTPDGGYVLDALTVTDANSNNVTVINNEFTMPASAVTVTATFKLNEKPAATLTLSKNGVEEPFPGSWKQDDVVTLPSITSDCVKQFVGWSADANCATAPEYAPGASYTLASTSQTLYAVYATVEGGEATASVDMATYATDNSWGSSSSTNQKEININSDLKAVISEGGNSGKYYNDGVRIYQTEDATVTVSTTAGELKSVKFTFTIANAGTLLHEGVAMTSDEAVEVSGNSAVFTVGDTHATENKGQVRFTAIEVVYTSGVSYSAYSTTCSAALANPTFSLAEGKYTEAKSVTISAEEGTIYYTTDGTTPTASSTQYSTPIPLDECGEFTIKAIAISSNSQSDVVSATYTIKLPLTNSQAAPYTEAEAIAVYDGGCYDNQDVYVKGTVKTATFYNSGTYTITLTNGFQFYKFYKDGSKTLFADGEINKGDVLVACGKLSKYNTTYQLAEGCYLVEHEPYTEPKTDISNTEATAYTVDKAFELIADPSSDLTKEVYVKGLVAVAPTSNPTADGQMTYKISDTGENAGDVLTVYLGLNLNGEKFTSKNDVQQGDYVLVKGKLLDYNSTYELNKGNQLVQHVKAATITIADITMEVGETKTIAATITPDAAKTEVAYSIKAGSDDCITLSENTITAEAEGTATIVATIATAAEYMGKTVEFKVTVNPVNIATLPFAFDGGVNDVKNTLGMSQKGLGSDYGSSPKLKFDDKDDYVIIHFDERPGKLTYDIKANTGSGDFSGAFTVQESADGVTYRNLAVYETITGSKESKTHNCFDKDTRYIKFIFTTKGNGNVALGNIKIEKSVVTKVTPTIVENAYFSVGNNKYVQFSTGNLQYEVGTNTWSFAEEQYKVIGGEAYTGSNNTNYGMNEPGYTGKLDLFGWSSDGKFGVNPSNTDAHYGYAGSDFVDWGELVNETGWYTLNKEEMRHILNRTKDGKKLWALATINDLVGLILLPDNWDTNISLVYGYVPTQFVYTENQLTIEQWEELETAGAVFLPAGGSRTGGYGNTDKAGGTGTVDANEHYFHVDNVNIYGYYWLNTQDPRETHKNCASFLILPGWDEGPTVDAEGIDDLSTPPTIWSREKRRGNSVRLVKEVNPNYTRDGQGAGVYGTVCYPENIVWVDGATLYEVAGKEGNKVIFDEVTTPEAGMPYIFIADQEVINFFCGTEEAAIAEEKNSLKGTFDDIAPAETNALTDNYVLYNNIIKKCGAYCGLKAYRAYFIGSELDALGAPNASQAPGRRRISLDVQSENTTTDLENILNGENTTIKVIENGQLIIIRNGEKFNAQGVRF